MKKFLLIAGLCGVFLLLACSDQTLSRKDEISQYIETGVKAAENRSHREIADLIAADYVDNRNFDKQRLVSLIQGYFLLHKNINLFVKLGEITFPADNEAFVSLHVAMTGSVISNARMLTDLRAQIYKIELQLARKENWLLHQAKWKAVSGIEMQ